MTGTDPLPDKWIAYRYEVQRDCWTEIGTAEAHDAGEAFRKIVMPHPGMQIDPLHVGAQFRILRLEGAANIAIELILRDLDYVAPTEGAHP